MSCEAVLIIALTEFTVDSLHWSNSTRQAENNHKMRLSSVHTRRTSQILVPSAIKFSPCIGLITSSSPNLIANLRTVDIDLPSAELARELFHQRTSVFEGGLCSINRRYGPLALTMSRSRAAYWLSPQSMGTIIGLAKSAIDSDVRIQSFYCA